MGLVGLEPTTSRLKARYSTIELQTHKKFKFSRFGMERRGDPFPIHETNIPWLDRLVKGVVATWPGGPWAGPKAKGGKSFWLSPPGLVIESIYLISTNKQEGPASNILR
jgi:hypothetical protein